jgi:predicted O-linked N-acetylglucosamine transferase (SPINDLY family)
MPQLTIQDALQLAIGHQQAGRLAEAEGIYRQVLAANPQQPDALHLLGMLAFQVGKFGVAHDLIRQALAVRPGTAEYLDNLSRALTALGRADEAIVTLREMLAIRPDAADAHRRLGILLQNRGRHDEAIPTYQRAAALNPTDRESRHNLAVALHATGRRSESAEQYRKVLAEDPNNVNALNDYANLLVDLHQRSAAIELYQQAISLEPQRAALYNNLANVYRSSGELDEAIRNYRRTLELDPQAADVHSNLLLMLNSHPCADTGLLPEHAAWAQQHAARFYPSENRASAPSDAGERRVRVGYVSADFREHAVASFLEPILRHHDRNRFEIFCYSNVTQADALTQRIRGLAGQWRQIVGMSDDAVARMIREDQIDILIDLSGHTAGNRLLVFARKPAPVQMTYLGYPNTTGLKAIDYRITDAGADPVGMTESHHSETLIRLPDGFLCYQPPADAPEPREGSADDPDRIVLGTFNSIAKITSPMLDLWARILRAVKGSSLLLKGICFADAGVVDRMRKEFQSRGVEPSAIELLTRTDSAREHLALYHRMDIALDTSPYNGTTTTCEALWMGVPVVTLAGRAHVSRVGASILNRIGLDLLIAGDPQQYVDVAVSLAKDRARLADISGQRLRDRMRNSKLLNAASFVHAFEAAILSVSAARP